MYDRALMHLISATLSSSAILCAIGSTSARDLWVRLQEQFSIVSRTAIFQMKSNLYAIKKGTDSMTQYLQRIKEARDFLVAAGVTFEDEDIVILALNGLPSEYNTFRCVIRGRENVISLKDFRFQLLADEVFVQNNSSIPFLSAMVAQDQRQGSKDSITANYGHGSSASNGSTQNLGFQGNGHSSLYASLGCNGGTGHNQSFYSKSKGTCKSQYNQGQRYSNPKRVVHDFSSQFNNGASYSTITCQLCAQQGHSAANCIYRITDSPESCQICNRRNHSAVTCLYRNMTYSSAPPMTAMHTSFTGQNQSYAMPSHLSNVVRCGKGQIHYNNGPRFNTYKSFPKFSPGVLGSPPSSYPNSQKGPLDAHCYHILNTHSSVSAPESCQSTLKISQGILGSHPPLTNYCECCWPNDGCFSGCNHVYGRRGDYIPIEHDVTNDMPSEGADKERIESMFDEKLEIVATKKAILFIELYDLQNHNHRTPLTPSFQCSDHEINVSISLCHSTSYLPSLESDLTIKSSNEKSTQFPLENSETSGILLETSNTLSDICSYHLQDNYDNIGKLGGMHTLSRLYDGASIVDLKLAYHMLISDKGGGPTFFCSEAFILDVL